MIIGEIMITKKDIKKIIIIFLVSRMILFIFLTLKKDLNIFDSIHYLNIAENGYGENTLYAFFPLFPLVIRLFHFIIPSYYISGLIVSNICSLISSFVLYLIIDKQQHKIPGVVLFLFSPILGFTLIAYTESLYILLTLLAFYLYKRNKLLSGIFVGLSMLTRNTGIILLGAFVLDLLIKIYKKEIKIKELLIFIVPAITIGFLFSIYLYIKTSDPFMYITIQTQGWDKLSSNIISLFIRDFQSVLNNKSLTTMFIQNWLFWGLALWWSIKYFKKDFIMSIYTIISLIAFTLTCRNGLWDTLPSMGLFRYVYSLFPLYLFLLQKEKGIKLYYAPYLPLIILSIINTIVLFTGNFIG